MLHLRGTGSLTLITLTACMAVVGVPAFARGGHHAASVSTVAAHGIHPPGLVSGPRAQIIFRRGPIAGTTHAARIPFVADPLIRPRVIAVSPFTSQRVVVGQRVAPFVGPRVPLAFVRFPADPIGSWRIPWRWPYGWAYGFPWIDGPPSLAFPLNAGTVPAQYPAPRPEPRLEAARAPDGRDPHQISVGGTTMPCRVGPSGYQCGWSPSRGL